MIEAALAAGLVAIGVTGHHALAAVLLYRLISFFMVGGWAIMAVLVRRGHRGKAAPSPDTEPL